MAKSITTPTIKTKKAPSIKTKTKSDEARRAAPVESNTPQEDRDTMIRNAAYFLAESDGFQPGREEEYWSQAESQIDQLLRARPSVSLEDKH